MPFLDSGTSILEFDGRTIYKAKRAFQESSPYARNITAAQDGIAWDDGEYHFDLTIKRMKAGEQEAGSGRPATSPESKSEGSHKPQPEVEGLFR